MERKKNTIEKNFDLKTEAMDALVNNDAEKVPEYSKEELKKYRGKGSVRIPNWLKMICIKSWFAGAVCFFILWGLGN